MKIIYRFYRAMRRRLSRQDEIGELSAGVWPDRIRRVALELSSFGRGRALEVGCGEGLFLKRLLGERADIEAFGIDYAPAQLSRASARCMEFGDRPVRLALSDACDIPFRKASFDMVFCLNMFINLPSKRMVCTVMEEIARVSKPGSIFIFDIRNRSNPFVWIKYGLVGFYDDTVRDTPLRAYSMKWIARTLEMHGFAVMRRIDVGGIFGMCPPVVVYMVQRT